MPHPWMERARLSYRLSFINYKYSLGASVAVFTVVIVFILQRENGCSDRDEHRRGTTRMAPRARAGLRASRVLRAPKRPNIDFWEYQRRTALIGCVARL